MAVACTSIGGLMSDKRYTFPLAVKFSPDDQAGTFTAYGSTFDGKPDAHGDIIAPGAFASSIALHRAKGTSPALLWSHDQSQPIGVITQLYENAKGLRVDGKLALDVEKGSDAYALMKMGALSLSIGYQALDSKSLGTKGGGRRLIEINLYEVSAVSMPSNTDAKIISVKLTDQNNPRVVEKILRDAGISRLHAKRILSIGKKAFRRDAVLADHNLSQKLIAAKRAIELI